MYHQIQHERKWSEDLLNSVYKDFLTKEEITSLLENKDLWMDVDEVLLRIEERMSKQEQEHGKN